MTGWPDRARVHAKGKPISPLEPVTRMVCEGTVFPLCQPADVEMYRARTLRRNNILAQHKVP